MTDISAIRKDLADHLSLCREILGLIEREAIALRDAQSGVQFGFLQEKKSLLARLEHSVESLKSRRQDWQTVPPPLRAQHRDIDGLLRQNQDLIMKIIVLDRENEQSLLRRGLVPSLHLPPPNRQRPHFVAELYRRQSVGGATASGREAVPVGDGA